MFTNTIRKQSDTTTLKVEGVETPVILKQHPRAHRMSLRLSPYRREAVLTIPPRGKIEEASQFLTDNAEWLKERLAEIAQPVPFSPDSIVPFRGIPHQLRFAGTYRRHGVVTIEKDDDLPILHVSGAADHAPRRLTDWFKTRARRDLDQQVLIHAKQLGLTPKRIAVRDQVSRWGSCSTSGTLSFSWRLILAPPEILDYVAAHEVAHLKEMNHSSRFWKLVEKTFPEYREARDWLRINGPELHRYGAAI